MLRRCALAWSYKTNYLQAICRVFHRRGAWAEVVSPMEFDKALHTGVPADHIHFNGPFKPDAAIGRQSRGGSPIHSTALMSCIASSASANASAMRPASPSRVNPRGRRPYRRRSLWPKPGIRSGSRGLARRVIAGGGMDLVCTATSAPSSSGRSPMASPQPNRRPRQPAQARAGV